MFGSTVEYSIRTYTNEFVPAGGKLEADGSLHGYFKQAHFYFLEHIDEFFSENRHVQQITTPMYPFRNNHLPEIVAEFKKHELPGDKNILLYADNLRDAEINLLFQYYKIAIGSVTHLGLDIFFGTSPNDVVNWNKDYKHWSDMEHWELREWLSLLYVGWTKEFIDSQYQVPENFLKIKNTNFLYDTKNTMNKILNYCEVTVQDAESFEAFIDAWIYAQQYIVSEFNEIDKIIENTLNQIDYTWSDLSIVSEAIIQQRLRSKKFELKCNGLNIFPTDSKTLYSLLEKC